MNNNLIPPFVMREVGIEVCDTPKIHMTNPSIDNHVIHFRETNFKIPLQLWGVFSYFHTSKPTIKTMAECEEVYMLTPKHWDPHNDTYEQNEANMLDYRGEMLPREKRKQVLLRDVEVSSTLQPDVRLSAVEEEWINKSFETPEVEEEGDLIPKHMRVPHECDKVAGILSDINPNLVESHMVKRMHKRAEIGALASAIGLLGINDSPFILEDKPDDKSEDEFFPDEPMPEANETQDDHRDEDSTIYVDNEDELLDELLEDVLVGAIDLDEVMAASAGKPRG